MIKPTDQHSYLYSKKESDHTSRITVDGVVFGGMDPVIIAGPCSVESIEQIRAVAYAIQASGGHMLRGGAFKPRTSPYSFQGLGEEGLKILKSISQETNLPFVTEVLDTREVKLVSQYADMLQVGARNMQNFALLRELGKQPKPVLLKRGMSATLEEWLLAAEYILREGNDQVVLCERGIRTFEPSSRNILDLNSACLAKQRTHLPIIADPSHASGLHELIFPLSRASIAAGLDGLMIEVHPNPEKALSDGRQSLDIGQFKELMESIKKS